MRAIRVHYADGTMIETNINGTNTDINRYYLGQNVNLGDGADGDRMVKAVRVEFLDEDSGMIEIGDQVQSIECNWQGRVTGFDKLDGDDCTYLVCHHVSGGEIELDDKRWFDPRDVRLLRRGVVTQARAAEIVSECQKRATIGPWSDQLRSVMHSDEIAQVTAHWKTMSGSASFSDAILQIRNGK